MNGSNQRSCRMRERAKRIWTMTLGFLIICCSRGSPGFFLPFLQGILFLLIGLPLVETSRLAKKLLLRLQARFPVRPSTGPLHRRGFERIGSLEGKHPRSSSVPARRRGRPRRDKHGFQPRIPDRFVEPADGLRARPPSDSSQTLLPGARCPRR